MAESNSIGILYHYTDFAGITGIRQSRKIKQPTTSTFGAPNIVVGGWVYFTKMPPSVGKMSLLSNNFRAVNGMSPYGYPMRKCDYYVKLDSKDLPSGVVQVYGEGRDVYKYFGSVDLEEIPFEWGETGGRLPSDAHPGGSRMSFYNDPWYDSYCYNYDNHYAMDDWD